MMQLYWRSSERVSEGRRSPMAKCDTCGNDYDRSFTVIMVGGERYTFDCFECAISKVAPTCMACGIKVIGHGVQAYGRIYCCAHCAREESVDRLKDRVS
jgi:hypothetical protein